jgi:hypothetical protein
MYSPLDALGPSLYKILWGSCVILNRWFDLKNFFFGEKLPSNSQTGWWYTYPSEKWWSSSVGMMTFPIDGNIH